jgi:oligopeptide transport system substrate-binding protein
MCGWRNSPADRNVWFRFHCLEWRRASLPACLSVVFHLLGLLILSGCAKRDSAAAKSPDTATPQVLRLSQRNEPGDLDAAITTLPDEFAILRALSEGLLIPGPNGQPQPGAASRYEVSADGFTYSFHLRPNLRWSNGEPLTAHQLVASWRRVLTPSTAAPKANVFYPVKNARAFVSGAITDFSAVGINAPNARTIVITLDRPTPRFPYYVASGPWLPAPVHVIEKHGRHWTRPENFVGNGPFSLAEWRPDQRIVARKNPHWHGAAGVRLAEIHFIRFDSGDTEDRAFRTAQIDATMAVPFAKVETYLQERPTELHRAPMIETRYFSFNTQRHPLNDERVRRALSLALDRKAIVDRVLKGGQEPATRLIPPALRDPAAAAASSEFAAVEHRHDPDAARQLLAATGIKGSDFPRFELTAWSPSQTPVLEAAQQMWRQELGIEFSIAIREARVHLSALAAGNYDIAFVIAIPDVADAAELMGDFVSKAPENYPQWGDAGFDAALTHAATQASAGARAAALLVAERHLLKAAPIAPVYFNTKIWLMSPRIRGWQEDGLWSRCYHDVYLDEK